MAEIEDNDIEERKHLLNTINELRKQIQITRDKIFKLYTLKRQTEEFLNDSDMEEFSMSTQSDPNLELYFYSKYIQIKVMKDESSVTILFPYISEYRFGLNIIKNNGKWILDKTFLPHSVDIEHFKKEINDLTLPEIPKYMEQIQANVNAYCIREEQIIDLKNILPSKIQLYHCIHFIDVELTCKTYDKNKKYQNTLTLFINYDYISSLPIKVFCKIKGNENEEKEQYFNEHFKIFYVTSLVSAFNEIFKGSLNETFLL